MTYVYVLTHEADNNNYQEFFKSKKKAFNRFYYLKKIYNKNSVTMRKYGAFKKFNYITYFFDDKSKISLSLEKLK